MTPLDGSLHLELGQLLTPPAFIHDSLEKDTPEKRAIEPKPATTAIVTSMSRLGGLHHRYAWREAA